MPRDVQFALDRADPARLAALPEPPFIGGTLVLADPEGSESCPG